MDENINRAMLGNFGNNCDNMEIRRTTNTQSPQVPKTVENGNLHFMSIQGTDQEFIDHTLLGPEYISNAISNSFIIDLMEQQDSPGQPATDCPIASLSRNEAFSSESQLHTIFQFVNRQGQVRTQANISAESSSDHLIHHSDKEILDSEFLAMHGNLLNEQNLKIFYSQQSTPSQEALSQELNVSPLQSLPPVQQPPLTPMRWLKKERYHESVDDICDIVEQLGATAKKTLPHKKRISKKLKIMDKPENLFQTNEESPPRNERIIISRGTHFECELCGAISESQVKFFSHLKAHYEPNTLEPPTKANNESIQAPSIEVPDDIPALEKTDPPQTTVVGDQVFNEVELNFDSFSEVVGLSTQHQEVVNNAPDRTEMKILSSNVIANCMDYVVQTQDSAQACSVRDEVEFSDTEDMLEGIRGVVDKVSVDDTSDIDMPRVSVSKEHWFTSNAFNLNYKEEAIPDDQSFERVSNLIPMPPLQPNNTQTIAKSPTPVTTSDEVDFGADADYHEDQSSDEFNDSFAQDSNEKRKRGRPKGSKKKKDKSTSSRREEDDSSNEMEDSNKRRYICSKCNREFNSCNALKYHDLSHTGERPHQCDVCGKSFFAQSALKSHLRVHTGDKPYECDKCHRKFRQWSDLKYHNVSIHSDEKNYQCEFCGKSFSRKYSLVIHRRIHTSERNYKCEFCPKSFRASSYLQNHRKIHTGEKPYECTQCGKKFRLPGDLRRHQRTHERGKKTFGPPKVLSESGTKLHSQLDEAKSEVLLKIDYQKEGKDDLLFLDTKLGHLLKTEDDFVNASIENTELSFGKLAM